LQLTQSEFLLQNFDLGILQEGGENYFRDEIMLRRGAVETVMGILWSDMNEDCQNAKYPELASQYQLLNYQPNLQKLISGLRSQFEICRLVVCR
jgi:hypothetical protein